MKWVKHIYVLSVHVVFVRVYAVVAAKISLRLVRMTTLDYMYFLYVVIRW